MAADRTALPAPPVRLFDALLEPGLRGAEFHGAIAAAILGSAALAVGACFLGEQGSGLLVHLSYLPVLIAAFAYGWRGGLPVALVTGIVTIACLPVQPGAVAGAVAGAGKQPGLDLLLHVAMLALVGTAAGGLALLLRDGVLPASQIVPRAGTLPPPAEAVGGLARRVRPLRAPPPRLPRAEAALLPDLARALGTGAGLSLAYQPKVELRDGSCTGAEALVRWRHETLGPIPPDRFIPLVEETPLIRELTHWVLRTALDQLEAWRRDGMELTLSVNISARNLMQVDFVRFVSGELMARNLPPERLELEVTESALMIDPLACIATLQALKTLGVQIAIDDFGTGHSSMAYLRHLPADTLKIDRSFIDEIDVDRGDEVIVRATILIARYLRMRVVAEGVENGRVYEKLRRFRCDECQGYHIARPMPAPEFAAWMDAAATGPAFPTA